MDSVEFVAVNLLTNKMTVRHKNSSDIEKIIEACEAAGYGASLASKEITKEKQNDIKSDKKLKSKKIRLIFSILLMLILMYIAMGEMLGLKLPFNFEKIEASGLFALSQMLISAIIMLINYEYFTRGFKAIFYKNPNMDSLIALGSSASFIYSVYVLFKILDSLMYMDFNSVSHLRHSLYFESAAMILTLISIGKYLEDKSKHKATKAIRDLMDLAPKFAVRIVDGREEKVSVDDLRVSDIILIKPGEKAPVDGIVMEGGSDVDTSSISGESLPIYKKVGDRIISSSIILTGTVKLKAEKVGSDTEISKIIRLVEDANQTKAPIAKLADKVSGIFIPIVILISLVTFLIWNIIGIGFEKSLIYAISVLVVSCPCALGLATPVAIMVATGKAARNSILIKSGQSLESIGKTDLAIFDKTGTITYGYPAVTDILEIKETNGELLKLAASLEKHSEHPIAKAVVDEYMKSSDSFYKINNFRNLSGSGIIGEIEGKKYFLGKISSLENRANYKEASKLMNDLSRDGKTVMGLADDSEILGLIAVIDLIKPSSKEAIESLQNMKIKVLMLTGDNFNTASKFARDLNIEEFKADVLPSDKERYINSKNEEGYNTLMVGDGINDAPSLARAKSSIAIGSGTDIAVESADMVILNNNLLDVVNAIGLSKATLRNIKENLFWAFIYNIILIPIAAGAFSSFGIVLNPMLGSLAMSLSSLFVVGNALRLNNYKMLHKSMKEQIEERDKKYNLKNIENDKDQIKINKKIEGEKEK